MDKQNEVIEALNDYKFRHQRSIKKQLSDQKEMRSNESEINKQKYEKKLKLSTEIFKWITDFNGSALFKKLSEMRPYCLFHESYGLKIDVNDMPSVFSNGTQQLYLNDGLLIYKSYYRHYLEADYILPNELEMAELLSSKYLKFLHNYLHGGNFYDYLINLLDKSNGLIKK